MDPCIQLGREREREKQHYYYYKYSGHRELKVLSHGLCAHGPCNNFVIIIVLINNILYSIHRYFGTEF